MNLKELVKNIINKFRPSKPKVEEYSKIKFYTHKIKPFGSIFTVCWLLDEQGVVLSRGVSICSIKDIYNRTKGRNKALGRAKKALYSKNRDDVIETSLKRFKHPYVNRTFKVEFSEGINKLDDVKLDLSLLGIKFKERMVKERQRYEINCRVPLNLPLVEAAINFVAKSEYRPKLSELEENWLYDEFSEDSVICNIGQ